MTISLYSDLVSELQNYLGIPASSSRVDQVPLFIQLAEARFNLEIRVREMSTTVTLSVDGDGFANLPDDYAGFQRATALEGTRVVDLVEMTPEMMDDHYPLASSGCARHISVEGSQAKFRPIPTGVVTLRYYAMIPELSDSNQDNWLLGKSPGIYVSAAMVEAENRFQNTASAQAWEATYQRDKAILLMADRSERGTRPPARMKGPTP